MHRFIVYQYGKVGSTSVVNALNQLPESEAFQSHFLGETAFADTLTRLQDPAASDYVFEHSAGQLIENLRIYRHYLRRGTNKDKLTVISLTREPFDWFRSCITQDIAQHLNALHTQLNKQGISFADDGQAIERGMALVFSRLLFAINHFGTVEELTTEKRFQLREILDTADYQDFRAFMFFLHMFIRPHIWFRSHFKALLETDIRDLTPGEHGVFRRQKPWGGIYLLRFEDLAEGFPQLLDDLGYPQTPPLPQENLSAGKLLHDELERAFASDQARQLGALCHSPDTRYLGY